MEEVVTTVLFDGQFWIAIIEKINEDGGLSVGKHTFGSEPSNPELLAFMRDRYVLVPAFKSAERVRVKAGKSREEQERSTGKAKALYAELRSKELVAEKRSRAALKAVDDELKFALAREKKKKKRRGH
jgi:hypothetical protein